MAMPATITQKYGRGQHPNSRKNSPFVSGHKVNVGKPSPMLGNKHSAETRQKISEIAKLQGHGKWMKGRKLPKEWVDNMRIAQVGKKRTLESRKRISESRKGANSHWWQGGLTKKNLAIRNSFEYKLWREEVFKRDDHTCQECGARSGNGVAVVLNADHIKPFFLYPESRFDIDNGRTLCVDCHRMTSTFGSKARNLQTI